MPDQEIDDHHIRRLIRELCVDGVIVNYTHEFPPRLSELLEKHRIPSVWVNVKQDGSCVHPDDFGSGPLAVQWLGELGHRKIGYATFEWDEHSHYSVPDRCAGYERAMTDAGLAPNVLKYGRSLRNDDRNEQLVAWLKGTAPTAVHTQSSAEAHAVYVAAEKLGLHVPGDLSILTILPEGGGVAGVDFDALQLPSTQVGRRAVEMLTEKIANSRAQLGREAIPFYFGEYRRHSTAPLDEEREK
jgi:LacI family transcriptional regulator